MKYLKKIPMFNLSWIYIFFFQNLQCLVVEVLAEAHSEEEEEMAGVTMVVAEVEDSLVLPEVVLTGTKTIPHSTLELDTHQVKYIT